MTAKDCRSKYQISHEVVRVDGSVFAVIMLDKLALNADRYTNGMVAECIEVLRWGIAVAVSALSEISDLDGCRVRRNDGYNRYRRVQGCR